MEIGKSVREVIKESISYKGIQGLPYDIIDDSVHFRVWENVLGLTRDMINNSLDDASWE